MDTHLSYEGISLKIIYCTCKLMNGLECEKLGVQKGKVSEYYEQGLGLRNNMQVQS